MYFGFDKHRADIINMRVMELERKLEIQDDFKMLSTKQFHYLLNLKEIVGECNWIQLDDYICSKNAEYEYIINYFYINGLHDAKNLLN